MINVSKLENIANFLIDIGYNEIKKEMKCYKDYNPEGSIELTNSKTFELSLDSIKTGAEILKVIK